MGKPGRSGAKPKYQWPEVGKQRVMSGDFGRIRSAACMFARKVGAQFKTQTVECFLIVRRVR